MQVAVRIAISILFLVLSSSAIAQDHGVMVHKGMGTGEYFMGLTTNERALYAMGVVNGVLLSPLFGAPKERTTWFESCAEGMSNTQVAAILSQYIEQHPSEWHEGLHILSYRALLAACPDSPLDHKATK